MSDYRTIYKKRLARRGKNAYERNLNNKQREFDRFFSETLTKHECLINGEMAELAFQDHSQSNNKDLSDDKYIIAQKTTKIGIGDYITWQNGDWLVFTEEFKTINTHQQLKIKAVNETIKWIKDGQIVNSEKGWGAYVQSQTLYTLGVSVGGNIAAVDSKMMMYMQNNADTRTLRSDDRVFVGFKVYKIKFMDPVSRPGLINYLLEEDTIGEYDNVELAVADYYRYFGRKDQDDDSQEENLPKIDGEKFPKINGTYVYKLTSSDFDVTEWTIESLGSSDNGVYLLDRNSKSITIQFKNDFRYVGNTLNVLAKLNNEKYISQSVLISKRY